MADMEQIQQLLQDMIRGPLLEIEEKIAALEKVSSRLSAVERAVREIKALGQDFWREEAAAYLAPPATSWQYQASNPKSILQDVYGPEAPAGSPVRRWVSRIGATGARIVIGRTVPLRFAIEVEAFVAPDCRKSFSLTVDDEHIPWQKPEGRLYWAIVPPAAKATLNFRLAVAADAVPGDRDVSFAFSSISVSPLDPAGRETELAAAPAKADDPCS
jgi:hypothetical protein